MSATEYYPGAPSISALFAEMGGKPISLFSCLTIRWILAFAICVAFDHPCLAAPSPATDPCPRPAVGSLVPEPEDLRSHNGVLEAQLTEHNMVATNGSTLYCFTDAAAHESPTLRVSPGDLVILHLMNALSNTSHQPPSPAHNHAHAAVDPSLKSDPCTSGAMTPVSTNLHFHGLTIPPVCHQDDVMKTSLQPGDAPFEYRFRIPDNEPPGLYWYHPHIHGFSKQQLLGGASGALIVEGIERAKKAAAGLPERVFIIRDQDLLNPNAPPSKSEPVVPKFLVDRDGDAANTGTGFGKPAKDLSINYVPVPYPDYAPALISMRPGERQLWRVLNASAITYLNIEVLFQRKPQTLGLIGMDGVPMAHNDPSSESVSWQTHLGIPPGARVEFIVDGPPENETGLLVTRTVDTGPGGENDPNRMIAKIVASPTAPEPQSRLQTSPIPLAPEGTWLGNVPPVRVRRLYFSEKLADPNDPTSAIEFYLTVDGQQPKMFDMSSGIPDIVATQGTVEDWIIENRSSELHDFHIHQLHFLLLDYLGRPVNEDFLRDTVNVPYFNSRDLAFPSVRLRMDFRDPNTIGTFVYHCHILEHEDKGMMGSIRVDPGPGQANSQVLLRSDSQHSCRTGSADSPCQIKLLPGATLR
jgi:FtsP/CotA-like multicopper oxidase with cupredoxin domain